MARSRNARIRSARPRAGRPTTAPEIVTLTSARDDLCPLVRTVAERPHGKIGIAVRGKLQAYLVSARRLDDLERKARLYDSRLRSSRPRLRGTLGIVGDLEAASARAVEELERAVSRDAEQR